VSPPLAYGARSRLRRKIAARTVFVVSHNLS